MAYSKHALMRAPMKKTAVSFGELKPLLTSTPVMTAGALLALEAGSGALSAGVSKLKDVYDRHQSYKGMLEHAPSLRQHDQGAVKRYFNSLHRLNPHLMNDPLVAGGIVSQAIEAQEAMGGLKQPALALSRMAGDLVRSRSDFASATSREGGGPNIAQHLRPVIQAGFEQAELLRLGDTPEGRLKAQLEKERAVFEKERDALDQARIQAARREATEKFDAAQKSRFTRLTDLRQQEEATRARMSKAQGRQERFEAAFGKRPSLTRELQRRGIPVSTPRTVTYPSQRPTEE